MSDLFQGFASITKTVQQTLNSNEMRKIADKMQGYVMNFTETEQKVREATNEDPWGPTGPEMQEIASLTFQYDQFSEVMAMLWRRMLQDNKVAWRRVYKSLILLNYLLKNGSERVISIARDHMFELRALESYKCVDERGKDEGINVRHRVKLILELLGDEDQLRSERRKAKTEGREKYQGFSKEDMLVRGGGASSKFDSFERWNEKKEGQLDFDKKTGGERREIDGNCRTGHREVTAFDFNESHSHANGSPELGIRERTPEPTEANDIEDEDFGDFTSASATSRTQNQHHISPSAIPALPSLPTSASKANKSLTAQEVRGSTTLCESDLLGLDKETGTGQQITGVNLLDVLFSSPIQNNAAPNHAVNANASHDILLDLFSSPPAATEPTGNSHQLFSPSSPNNQMFESSEQHQNIKSEVNQTKVAKTWEEFKGKVNIDFDNLSLKSTSKATPSLNELKSNTTKESTSNPGQNLW